MKVSTSMAVASLTALAAAVPTSIVKRADMCDQYASVETGSYTLYNNLWGESGATSGSECTGLDSLSGDTIAWHSTWTWTGGTGVKSYPNVVLTADAKQLSAISSLESTWKWSYTGSDVVADVAYDLFTSSTASGDSEYEIMIWLAALNGAGPISSNYGSDGSATPIASSISLASNSWSLYQGTNGDTTVYSFIADSTVKDFSGDVMDFLNYLVSKENFSDSQYLTSIGAGTEPTTGTKATFTVSAFSISLGSGSSSSSSSQVASSSQASTVSPATSSAAAASSYVVASSSAPQAVSSGYAAPSGYAASSGYAAPSGYAASSGHAVPTSVSAAVSSSAGPVGTAPTGSAPTGGPGNPGGPDCEVQYVFV